MNFIKQLATVAILSITLVCLLNGQGPANDKVIVIDGKSMKLSEAPIIFSGNEDAISQYTKVLSENKIRYIASGSTIYSVRVVKDDLGKVFLLALNNKTIRRLTIRYLQIREGEKF